MTSKKTTPANAAEPKGEVTEKLKRSEQKARAAARSTAASRLRQAHREEHDKYLAEEMAAQGIDWKPKPTPEQKAKQDLERIYAEFPHLRPVEDEDEGDG